MNKLAYLQGAKQALDTIQIEPHIKTAAMDYLASSIGYSPTEELRALEERGDWQPVIGTLGAAGLGGAGGLIAASYIPWGERIEALIKKKPIRGLAAELSILGLGAAAGGYLGGQTARGLDYLTGE